MSQTYAELTPEVQALFPPLHDTFSNMNAVPYRLSDALVAFNQSQVNPPPPPYGLDQLITAMDGVNFTALSGELQTLLQLFQTMLAQAVSPGGSINIGSIASNCPRYVEDFMAGGVNWQISTVAALINFIHTYLGPFA